MALATQSKSQIATPISAEPTPPQRRLLIAILAFSATASLWMIHVGWNNSIYDAFGFRQTQTALSARSIAEGGPFFAYQTPLFGPPWRVPFEFPLYQALVGWSARWSHMPLDQTGRFISAGFFYAMLLPLYFLLRKCGVRRSDTLPFFCLLMASPFYVFWSRSFMMESCALFLALLYLTLALYAANPQPAARFYWLLAAAAGAGSLAGLVKVTTFGSFLIGGAALGLYATYKRTLNLRRAMWFALLVCMVPFFATTAWTHYADWVKLQDPFTPDMTSKALWGFTVGTIQQRAIPANYLHFWPPVKTIIGGAGVAIANLIALPFARCTRAVALLFGLWLCEILAFFNLFYLHSYYSYANGVFALLAFGFVINGLLRRGGRFWWAGIYLLLFCLGGMFMQYFLSFYPDQRLDFRPYAQAGEIIQHATPPNSVILVYGLDWSSELPYAAHRRAIMDREDISFPAALHDRALQIELARVPPEKLGVVAICGFMRDADAGPLLRQLSFPTSPYASASDCDIYVPQ